jgi:hypothetical protein
MLLRVYRRSHSSTKAVSALRANECPVFKGSGASRICMVWRLNSQGSPGGISAVPPPSGIAVIACAFPSLLLLLTRVTWVRRGGGRAFTFSLSSYSLDRPVLADFEMGSGLFCRVVTRTAYLLYSASSRDSVLPSFTDREGEIVGLPDPALEPFIVR